MTNKWLVTFILTMLLIAGCSKNDKTNGEKETAQGHDSGEAQEISEEKELPFQFPLTGLGTEKQASVRSVAVMINNHPQARPQSGLHQADIVYELLAEGDITRFLAIFQSEEPEKIGPIRSARDYYMELAKGYDSLYIAHGYSPDAKAMIDRGYVDNLNGMNYDGTLFKRASDRKAPHNSYTSFENVRKGAEKKKYEMDEAPSPLTFLSKEEVEEINGQDAKSVMVTYFNNSIFNSIYEYDEALGKYKRYSNGELTADHETNDPVLLDNIFIVETDHKVIDNSGRRSINLTSGGRGYLIQKGKWNEVEWENADGKIIPVVNGIEVGLVPGKTWINVIPSSPGLEQTISFDLVE